MLPYPGVIRPEKRHTVIAWMSNWQYANNVPTKQFRSANTLPRDIELYEGSDGELYLAATPAPEVNAIAYGQSIEIRRFLRRNKEGIPETAGRKQRYL